jgi:sulfur-oxidizing protein SoxY
MHALASAIRTTSTLMALAISLGWTGSAWAGASWDGIRAEVYGNRPILDGTGVMVLKAPTRPEDQRAVPISVESTLTDGRTIKSVTFIVDENPSPVAAVFHLGPNREHVAIASRFRVNAQTDVRVVVEASDGKLYMASQLVKFAGGQAACAAPPTGDPAEIAANMGRMELTNQLANSNRTEINPRVHLALHHPNHTGMQLDQLTLLYIPLRMVNHVDVKLGEQLVFSMDGSITVSENPVIDFDFRLNGADKLNVTMQDTDGTSWQKSFPVGPAS